MSGPNIVKTPFIQKWSLLSHYRQPPPLLIFVCLPGRNWRSREVDIVRLCKLILNVWSVTKVWLVSGVLHLKDLLLDWVRSRVDDWSWMMQIVKLRVELDVRFKEAYLSHAHGGIGSWSWSWSCDPHPRSHSSGCRRPSSARRPLSDTGKTCRSSALHLLL